MGTYRFSGVISSLQLHITQLCAHFRTVAVRVSRPQYFAESTCAESKVHAISKIIDIRQKYKRENKKYTRTSTKIGAKI